MTPVYVLRLDDPGATLDVAGGKGAALARMAAAGLPVPDGFHIATAAYRRFVAANGLHGLVSLALEGVDQERPRTLETVSEKIREGFAIATIPPDVALAIAQAYAELKGPEPVVAVRSSATAEDLPDLSFAGQQETYLNVAGIDAVLRAVKGCWASLWTARAIGYRARHNIDPEGLSLAVVVQRLVPAEVAGVLFTANPMNGRRDQALVNAAWGLGEAVVGGSVTPDCFIVTNETGQVVERTISDKRVMTVRVDGGTTERPVPDELRCTPSLTDGQLAELVALGARVEALYSEPRDIEWALADGVFAVVQARPITALPEPEAEPPTAWPMPDPKGQYLRGSIVDFMPDPLTPLFASMVVPAVVQGMHATARELLGGTSDLINGYLLTINDYAYMGMKLSARDVWWILTGMLPRMPRLLSDGVRHWNEEARPRYAEVVAKWSDATVDTTRARTLLTGVDELMGAMGRYLTTLQVDTLGVAAGSEMLFTRAYDKLVKREGDPPAPTYLLGADSLPIRAEKALFDLAQWCQSTSDLSQYLLSTPADQVIEDTMGQDRPAGLDTDAWRAWRDRFIAHLDQYGHSIYDLDFAKPIPADDPTPVLETLKLFVRDEGRDPHKRQRELVERREAAIKVALDRIRGFRRWIFKKTLGWAQTFTRVREDSIFDIGLGYPRLRRMLVALGRRMAEAGAIDAPDGIYWLTRDELDVVATRLDSNEPLDNYQDVVAMRRAIWHAEKRVTPPPQLPGRERIMGVKTDIYVPVSEDEQTETTLKGIGASPGTVTAPACVLHGPDDFDQMRPGDILVADITTPAWTPLFAMASGVVTNIGGPLSHGSIVAREYGIPAVLGTGVATKRIQSGQVITVDGDAGQVLLGDDGDRGDE